MELDERDTPEKLTHRFIINYQANEQRQSVAPCYYKNMTPTNSKSIEKPINPRTPKTHSVSYSVAACSSMASGSCSSLHSVSMSVVQTPPAKRYQRVRNPFEAALADSLHLPLIASPSLFQQPNTPQLSSTQFEWTIDQVSSLKPANLEPHETQFQDSPDPDLEARAQLAISSYFKEQQIVPSPIDCPLRSQRIILSELNGNTPLSKPGRRIRDCASQTELTLPSILPAALEEALKPYFQPHLACSEQYLKRSADLKNCENKDTSLRRKLFDMHNIALLENENQKTPLQKSPRTSETSSQSNSSPISVNSLQYTAIAGKLSDSSDKSFFGSLSPISASDSLSSPNCVTNVSKRKTRFDSFLNEVDVDLSPIHLPVRRKSLTERNRSQYRCHKSDSSKTDLISNNTSNETETNKNFTPERSSSPLNILINDNIAEFSTDSFNVKVSRLKVNSSKIQSNGHERINKAEHKSEAEINVFMQDDDTDDMLENTVDMDEMQVLQLSGHSSNCSSSQSDTPRGKRRSASRKNLSQSFSANWLQEEDEPEPEISQSMKLKELLAKKQFAVNTTSKTTTSFGDKNNQMSLNTTPKKDIGFYRTDSGFNELSQNSLSSLDAVKSQDVVQMGLEQQHEVLVCCSTPSTRDNFNFIV